MFFDGPEIQRESELMIRIVVFHRLNIIPDFRGKGDGLRERSFELKRV